MDWVYIVLFVIAAVAVLYAIVGFIAAMYILYTLPEPWTEVSWKERPLNLLLIIVLGYIAPVVGIVGFFRALGENKS